MCVTQNRVLLRSSPGYRLIAPSLTNNPQRMMMIFENQIFLALFLALINGIFAVRLGVALYK